MTKEEIYRKLKEIVKPHHGYTAQMTAIAEWVNSEFEALKQGQSLPIDGVSKNEAICNCANEYWKEDEGGDWYCTIHDKQA
jgi:hypothetical protein